MTKKATVSRGRRRTRVEDEIANRNQPKYEERSKSSSSATDATNNTRDDSSDSNTNINNNNNSVPTTTTAVLEKFALLGDTPVALGVSFVMLLLSMLVSVYLHFPEMLDNFMQKFPHDAVNVTIVETKDPYNMLGPVPIIGPPIIHQWDGSISAELKQTYNTDGVIAFRGLLDEDLIHDLQQQSLSLLPEKGRPNAQFHHVHHSAVFSNETTTTSANPFVRVALQSKISLIAAKLLPCPANETLRLIRDILLTKDADPYVCGWHVDDFGFWPVLPDDVGINAWIALDDMPVEFGGSMAVAVGSHAAPWAAEAHHAIGAPTNTSFPMPDGYASARDMLDRRTGQGTCHLQSAAPHLNRRMEETMRVYDVKAGDVLFMHRWMYHRTVKMTDRDSKKVYRRYSLRYGFGSAVIPPGYGTEWSVLYDPQHGGRSADEIAQIDGPWYPRAAANEADIDRITNEEVPAIQSLVEDKWPVAQERRNERLQEMKPLLKRLARQHHQQQLQKHREDNDLL